MGLQKIQTASLQRLRIAQAAPPDHDAGIQIGRVAVHTGHGLIKIDSRPAGAALAGEFRIFHGQSQRAVAEDIPHVVLHHQIGIQPEHAFIVGQQAETGEFGQGERGKKAHGLGSKTITGHGKRLATRAQAFQQGPVRRAQAVVVKDENVRAQIRIVPPQGQQQCPCRKGPVAGDAQRHQTGGLAGRRATRLAKRPGVAARQGVRRRLSHPWGPDIPLRPAIPCAVPCAHLP